jgi:hypothetical protein
LDTSDLQHFRVVKKSVGKSLHILRVLNRYNTHSPLGAPLAAAGLLGAAGGGGGALPIEFIAVLIKSTALPMSPFEVYAMWAADILKAPPHTPSPFEQ